MKHLFPLSLILAFVCATANLRAQTILPLITDSLTFIDPVEIRFSPLEREISGTVIPHLQSISYGPDKFCLRVSAFRLLNRPLLVLPRLSRSRTYLLALFTARRLPDSNRSMVTFLPLYIWRY